MRCTLTVSVSYRTHQGGFSSELAAVGKLSSGLLSSCLVLAVLHTSLAPPLPPPSPPHNPDVYPPFPVVAVGSFPPPPRWAIAVSVRIRQETQKLDHVAPPHHLLLHHSPTTTATTITTTTTLRRAALRCAALPIPIAAARTRLGSWFSRWLCVRRVSADPARCGSSKVARDGGWMV